MGKFIKNRPKHKNELRSAFCLSTFEPTLGQSVLESQLNSQTKYSFIQKIRKLRDVYIKRRQKQLAQKKQAKHSQKTAPNSKMEISEKATFLEMVECQNSDLETRDLLDCFMYKFILVENDSHLIEENPPNSLDLNAEVVLKEDEMVKCSQCLSEYEYGGNFSEEE